MCVSRHVTLPPVCVCIQRNVWLSPFSLLQLMFHCGSSVSLFFSPLCEVLLRRGILKEKEEKIIISVKRKGLFTLNDSDSENQNFLWCLPLILWSFLVVLWSFSLSLSVNEPLRIMLMDVNYLLCLKAGSHVTSAFAFSFDLFRHVLENAKVWTQSLVAIELILDVWRKCKRRRYV